MKPLTASVFSPVFGLLAPFRFIGVLAVERPLPVFEFSPWSDCKFSLSYAEYFPSNLRK
jgi:hypothetical protein